MQQIKKWRKAKRKFNAIISLPQVLYISASHIHNYFIQNNSFKKVFEF